jgi:hypothetical protein
MRTTTARSPERGSPIFANTFVRGAGAWYVAIDPASGDLAASCGVVVTEERGRFQLVDTALAFRRRGICSRLVVEAAQRSAHHGAKRLVIVADGRVSRPGVIRVARLRAGGARDRRVPVASRGDAVDRGGALHSAGALDTKTTCLRRPSKPDTPLRRPAASSQRRCHPAVVSGGGRPCVSAGCSGLDRASRRHQPNGGNGLTEAAILAGVPAPAVLMLFVAD